MIPIPHHMYAMSSPKAKLKKSSKRIEQVFFKGAVSVMRLSSSTTISKEDVALEHSDTLDKNNATPYNISAPHRTPSPATVAAAAKPSSATPDNRTKTLDIE